MKNKIFAIIFSLLICSMAALGFVACNGGGDGSDSGSSGDNSGISSDSGSSDEPIEEVCSHEYSDWTVKTAATCTQKGEEVRTCSKCNDEQTQEIDALGHNSEGTVAHKDADCTNDGVEGGTYCTRCNEGKEAAETVIPALGHDTENAELLYDDDEHWQICNTCNEKANKTAHSYADETHYCICGKADPDWTFTYNDETQTYTLTSYSGSQNSLVLFDNYDDGTNGLHTVSEIAANAFKRNSSLKSITFNSELTKIGKSAFEECSALQSVTFGANLEEIGDSAFNHCSALQSITFADNSKIKELGFYVFGHCYSLKSVNFGANCSLETIGNHAFSQAYALTSIDIPSSVKTLDAYAFSQTTTLATINFSENCNLESIGENAFWNSGLVTFTVPASLKSVHKYAFSDCDKLVEVINLGTETIEKGSDSFGGIAKNAKIVVNGSTESKIVFSDSGFIFFTYDEPDATANGTLTTNYLLGYVGSETSLVLPENYNGNPYVLYSGALKENNSLKSVTIPKNIAISEYAFYGCTALKTVVFAEDYALNTIGEYAFAHCSSLEFVTLPSSLTSISASLFRECKSLKSITIPKGVTELCRYAFYRCFALTDVVFEAESELTSIGNSAFANCYALISFTVPAKVTVIDSDAFYLCESLIEVFNFSALTIEVGSSENGGIAENAFVVSTNGTSSIVTDTNGYRFFTTGDKTYLVGYVGTQTSLILPESYNGEAYELKHSVFEDNEAIKSVFIPKNLALSDDTFYGCSSLETVTFADGYEAEYIGEYAFSYCTSLKSITIPASIKTLGGRAFSGCSALETITFEEGCVIESIGVSALWNCTALTTINYPKDIAEWLYGITKGDGWYCESGEFTFVCNDGVYSKEELLSLEQQ